MKRYWMLEKYLLAYRRTSSIQHRITSILLTVRSHIPELYFLFYVLPDLGVFLSPFLAGVIGIGLHFSTYTSEVFRAGIENVPKGQWEAAKSLNYNGFQTWRYVILPQAIPPMFPPLANYLITMFKETPLLAAITVVELFNAANIYSNSNYKYLEPMMLVGFLFLLVSIPAAYAAMKLEQRYTPKR